MSETLFDLNIDEFLLTWTAEDALRELIANAIDEQNLSSTPGITVAPDLDGGWHIRDFGRGLRPENFVQNETPEKRRNSDRMIGNFGVGLKDAIATLARLGVEVRIRSSWGSFRTTRAPKAGFDDIVTLHVRMEPGVEPVQGTDIELRNLEDAAMTTAMSWFLQFRPATVLEELKFGDILRPDEGGARVYVNGVFVAAEPDFLFSYNITRLLPSTRKGLNRDRRSITRDLYRERVVDLIEKAQSLEVLRELAKAVTDQRHRGELAWKPVLLKAASSLQASQKVVFLTATEMEADPRHVSNMREAGFEPITISKERRQDIVGAKTPSGDQFRTLRIFVNEWEAAFVYKFVSEADLTLTERSVVAKAAAIASMVTPLRVPPVVVSETLRPSNESVAGVWDPHLQRVIVKRSELKDAESFAATLLHELAHWDSGGTDISLEFEACLTKFLGRVAVVALRNQEPPPDR